MIKNTLVVALLIASVGCALAVYAVAQGTTAEPGGTMAPEMKEHPHEAMACPMCKAMSGDKKDRKECEEMMLKAGITQEMMHLCCAMGGAELYRETPAVLLAMEDDVLKLTGDQKKQLEDIDKEARTKAGKVLNEEQTKILETLPKGKTTMKEMRKEVHSKMTKEMGKEGKHAGMYCCPMMMKMAKEAEKEKAKSETK